MDQNLRKFLLDLEPPFQKILARADSVLIDRREFNREDIARLYKACFDALWESYSY